MGCEQSEAIRAALSAQTFRFAFSSAGCVAYRSITVSSTGMTLGAAGMSQTSPSTPFAKSSSEG